MRISDWSSDVCSSDLARTAAVHENRRRLDRRPALPMNAPARLFSHVASRAALASVAVACLLLGLKIYASWKTGSVAMLGSLADTEIGRASCRVSVGQYV